MVVALEIGVQGLRLLRALGTKTKFASLELLFFYDGHVRASCGRIQYKYSVRFASH